MNACDLRFPAYQAAARHAEIRWSLLVHREVRDVLLTLHSDTLRVRHHGPADPAGWRETLTAAGFPAPDVQDAPTQARPPAAVLDAAD